MRNFFATLFEGLPLLPAIRHATTESQSVQEAKVRLAVRERVKSDTPIALTPEEEHDERQQLAYWHLWRLIRPVDAAPMPPSILDASVPEHVTLALTVVGDYDAVRETPGVVANGLYRPVSDLPYPPASIRRCCEFLIAIAEGDAAASKNDRELLENEREALGLALFSLDFFGDGRPIPIRRDNNGNGKHDGVAETAPAAKPCDGDLVIRSGSGETDYVSDVVGLGENEEWIVLTRLGASIQVVRNAMTDQWDEVNVIAPAPARWLTLTPSGGTPSWES